MTAPPDVAWTSDELRQIGEALRALQSRLPGRYPQVTLDRISVVPRDEPGEAEPDVTAQLIAGCSCGGPGCPPPVMMSTMCRCGDMQRLADESSGNLFVPHVDSRTGEACLGLMRSERAENARRSLEEADRRRMESGGRPLHDLEEVRRDVG